MLIGNERPKSRLAQLREQFGSMYGKSKWTQEKVAKYVECTVKSYREWEKGKGTPETYHLKKLAGLFDVSTDYILGLSPYTNVGNREIVEITGLSESAVKKMKSYSPLNGSKAVGWYNHVRKMAIINKMIESPLFDELIENMIYYLCYGGAVPEYLPPVNENLELDFTDENRDLTDDELQTLQDHQDYRVWLESHGAVVKMKKDVCKMYLQEACEDFRKIAEEVFEQIREEE